jgi:hypothetical protein
MTQDEIIRMAREAGLHKMIRHDWKVEAHTETLSPKLERFAALVAEATKEKAARVCDEMATPATSREAQHDFHWAAGCCAAAIRSMK